MGTIEKQISGFSLGKPEICYILQVRQRLFLEIVVVDLDAEDDDAASRSDEVGDEKCPKHTRFVQ